jgi:hypothetical protein
MLNDLPLFAAGPIGCASCFLVDMDDVITTMSWGSLPLHSGANLAPFASGHPGAWGKKPSLRFSHQWGLSCMIPLHSVSNVWRLRLLLWKQAFM